MARTMWNQTASAGCLLVENPYIAQASLLYFSICFMPHKRAWHSPCSGTEGRTSEGHGNFFSGSGQLMPVTNSCGWDQTAITAEHTNATQCPRPGARRRAGPGRAARSELRRRAGAVRILRGARRRRAGVPGTAPRAAARGAGRAGGGGSALQRVKARARGPAGAVGAAA
ncbi:uncharacterized protein [Taeniopygia guttata]|uniref:uncharacterized protein isoform X1 n=1 Tax=Taeniopygia guttata TaxID=59729 RepID=UPI003BB8BF7C